MTVHQGTANMSEWEGILQDTSQAIVLHDTKC